LRTPARKRKIQHPSNTAASTSIKMKRGNMKVSVKEFSVDLDIKSKGIELEVRDPQGKHIGDLVVTNTKLVWCKGRISVKNGKAISWKDFQEFMEGN